MSDPRSEARIKRWERKTNPDELPADWLALASLMFGVLGLMMRYKWCAWLALFTCMGSIANMSKQVRVGIEEWLLVICYLHQDMDYKQIFCSVLFAVMGLVMNYLGVKQTDGSPA